jgi:hypothetical protein
MADEEDRFVLGIAYQAGRDPNIKKGADGFRDWATAREIELACHGFMKAGGQRSGLFHIDGTDDAGHARIVENYIYRGPDWTLANGAVVKAGDWLLGAILDEQAWALVKAGRITGWSPQGKARRVRSDD